MANIKTHILKALPKTAPDLGTANVTEETLSSSQGVYITMDLNWDLDTARVRFPIYGTRPPDSMIESETLKVIGYGTAISDFINWGAPSAKKMRVTMTGDINWNSTVAKARLEGDTEDTALSVNSLSGSMITKEFKIDDYGLGTQLDVLNEPKQPPFMVPDYKAATAKLLEEYNNNNFGTEPVMEPNLDKEIKDIKDFNEQYTADALEYVKLYLKWFFKSTDFSNYWNELRHYALDPAPSGYKLFPTLLSVRTPNPFYIKGGTEPELGPLRFYLDTEDPANLWNPQKEQWLADHLASEYSAFLSIIPEITVSPTTFFEQQSVHVAKIRDIKNMILKMSDLYIVAQKKFQEELEAYRIKNGIVHSNKKQDLNNPKSANYSTAKEWLDSLGLLASYVLYQPFDTEGGRAQFMQDLNLKGDLTNVVAPLAVEYLMIYGYQKKIRWYDKNKNTSVNPPVENGWTWADNPKLDEELSVIESLAKNLNKSSTLPIITKRMIEQAKTKDANSKGVDPFITGSGLSVGRSVPVFLIGRIVWDYTQWDVVKPTENRKVQFKIPPSGVGLSTP